MDASVDARVSAQIFERQHRDGRVGRRSRPPGVRGEQDNGSRQERNYYKIHAPTGDVGDRPCRVDVLFQADALWRQLVEPGEDQRDREPDRQQRKHRLSRPVRQHGEADYYLGHLHDHPGSDDVQHRHAKDIAAPEF
jgi:hypothetical protein